MPGKFAQLTEVQIKRAEAEGQLSNLDGEGKPLPNRPGDALTDSSVAIGHRIMAEAGILPEEFALKKALDKARAEFAKITDPVEKKQKIAEIADLELRYNTATEARRKFMR